MPSRLRLFLPCLITVAAFVAPAHAATVEGSATIAMSGTAVSALKTANVRTAAVAPAKLTSEGLVLPVVGGAVKNGAATLALSGSLRLTAGERRLTLTKLRLALGGASPSISALVGSARTTLFSIAGRQPTVSAATGAVDLRGARLSLVTRAATLIRSKLRLRATPSGTFGVAIVAAKVPPAVPVSGSTGGSGSGSTGSGATDGAAGSPAGGAGSTGSESTGSGSGSGGGGSGSGGSGSGSGGGGSGSGGPPAPSCNTVPTHTEPTLLTQPGGATSVTTNALTYHWRESFVDYIRSGGTNPILADGATQGGSIYDFRFAPAGGSWRSGNVLSLRYTGSVRFLYTAHGIDDKLSNPVVELNGSSSRIVFSVSENGGAAKLATVAKLSYADNVFSSIAGLVPGGAEGWSVTEAYCPGDAFGNVTASFTG